MLALCKHFNLKKISVDRFIAQEKVENGRNLQRYFMYFDFVKQFNLSVDKIDTANVFITAKHLTTQPDKGLALKKYGLLNLKDVLEKDTPLNRFLSEKGIEFNVNNKKIRILEMDLDLFRCNHDCKSCNIDKNKCVKFSPEYREAIDRIYIKLYSDKSETEVFLCGKDDELEKYSCITRHPEILYNIDKLLVAMQMQLTISTEWQELQNGKYYALEFDVGIRSLEYIPQCIYEEEPSYDMFERYFDFLGYTENHFIANAIPDDFYYNVFLVKNSLDVFWGQGKEYGQLFPSTTIRPSDLRISQKSI